MYSDRGYCSKGIRFSLALATLLCTSWTMFAQTQLSHTPANAPVAGTAALGDERVLAETRQQLLKLLRTTPLLTSVVARDPSLLSDQQYVARNNPALAQFLESHPEIARNAEFYLFANLGARDQGRDRDRASRLQREVWPEMQYRPSAWNDVVPLLVFVLVLCGLFWLIRLLVDNFRWNRAFKLQSETQGKLLDRFSGNNELIAYLETESGRRLLQVNAIPANIEQGSLPTGMLNRILIPLQLGVVLVFVGMGLRVLPFSLPNDGGILAFANVLVALGIGLSLAAAISWLMARHYGLLPRPTEK